jgi:hypothetical protein
MARASAGLIGFDETAKLNSATPKTYASKGYEFCVRSLRSVATPPDVRPTQSGDRDVTQDDALGMRCFG